MARDSKVAGSSQTEETIWNLRNLSSVGCDQGGDTAGGDRQLGNVMEVGEYSGGNHRARSLMAMMMDVIDKAGVTSRVVDDPVPTIQYLAWRRTNQIRCCTVMESAKVHRKAFKQDDNNTGNNDPGHWRELDCLMRTCA